jgi:hypothetical protein
LFISSSPIGSPSFIDTSSKRRISERGFSIASLTDSITVVAFPRSGSCGTCPTVVDGRRHASPVKFVSSPAMIRSNEDFPDPFGPITPIFAPGRNER